MINKTIIIAEAGVNYNGDIKLAKRMIKVAAQAGADFIKFQTFNADHMVIKKSNKAEYQKRNSNQKESQYEMLKKLELSKNMHLILINFCKKNNIKFLSSAFDLESLNFLNTLNLDYIKIPSGEITNLPYLRLIPKFKKRVILSTGISTLQEVKEAINILTKRGMKKKNIIILHCNTEYPTPMVDVNLKAIQTIKKKLNIQVGYSDHSKGIEVPIAAVAMGAKVIEKHFTLNRFFKGPDHQSSLEPQDLKKMIKAIRNIELAIGNGKKIPSKSELKNIHIVRKSIVALKNIKIGEKLTCQNITVKRPGNGITPMNFFKILGKKSPKNFKKDDLIKL